MNTPTIAQVEDVVRAVLLARRSPTAPTGGPSMAFAGRLLGQRHVEAIDRDIDELLVAPGTVITPIARDVLRRRGIAVRLTSEAGNGRSGTWGFGIEPDCRVHADAIRRTLLGDREAWNEVGGDAVEVGAWAVGGPDRGAVVLAGESSVPCWRANRIEGVRAATASDADAAARAVDALGANVIVLEPRWHSIPALIHCCRVFRRAGAPRIPQWLDGSTGSVRDEDRRNHRPGHVHAAASEHPQPPLADRRPALPSGDQRRFTGAW